MESTIIAPGVGGETGHAQSLRDYARLRAQVVEALEDLARINDEVGQPARAARVLEVAQGLLAQRFTLLILGEFKRGKSTLVNRLLGADTLPVGAAPTTAVLTRVTYGEEPSARIVLEDGSERPVDVGRLAEEITLVQSDEGTNQQRHAGVVRAEVTLPAALCRDGVDVVDSPGLGEHRTRTEVTYEALPNADAVIFVSDAAQLGNEDEEFVRTWLANENIDNVFFVINKWDRVYNEAEDPEAEIAALKRRAWSLFVPEPKVGYNGQDLRANRIYPLSCRPNLVADEERGELAALFEAFRADLESFLVRESGRVALERALARARAQVTETLSGLRARVPALEADLAEFERRAAAAETELRKLEGPRQAIRNQIAAKRQEIRREVRRRAIEELPGVETKIKEEFTAKEYRPQGQLSQRILDGVQDSFRRSKIREEMRTQVREIAAAQLEPWAAGVNSYVEAQVAALLKDLEPEVGRIDATFEQANRIMAGLDEAPDTAQQDQEDVYRRGLAAGIGLLLGNPFAIASGGMYGFKGLGRTALYQMAGGLVIVMIGLPALPALSILAAGAVIAQVQNNDEFLADLKEQVAKEVLDRLHTMRTTGLPDLEAQATAPLEACSLSVEQLIEGRIADHREGVEAMRAQMGTAREESTRQRSHLAEAQHEVAAIATRLEALEALER